MTLENTHIIMPGKHDIRKYTNNHAWEAAQVPKALKMTSTMRWQVNTFPPTTAAVSDGSIKLPFRIRTSTGAKHP